MAKTVRVFIRPGHGSTVIPNAAALTRIEALGRLRINGLSTCTMAVLTEASAKHPASALPYVSPTPKYRPMVDVGSMAVQSMVSS